MKKLVKILLAVVVVFSSSCKNDDLFNGGDSSDLSKSSSNFGVKVNYNKNTKMFVVNGNAADFKDFVYSENIDEKSKMYLEAYDQGFEPLSVYGELGEDYFDKYSDAFEDIKEKNSLKIMDFSEALDEKEILEDGIDIHTRTFIGDNEFASLLNYNGQIQFNDSVYMYTPKGLFVVQQKQREHLIKFLTLQDKIEIKEGFNKIDANILGYLPPAAKFDQLEFNTEEYDFDIQTVLQNKMAFDLPKNTSNYSKCPNMHRPKFPNIFGRSYTCYNKITSTTRMKTVFRVQDFLLFNHTILKTSHQREKVQSIKVKIWPFKIKIKLFKYWENASATKLYHKINLAFFEIKRKNNTVTISDSQVKAIFQKVSTLLNPNPGTSQPKAMYVLSEEYKLNSTGKYNKKLYELSDYEVNSHNNYNTSILYPSNYTPVSNVTLGDLNLVGSDKKKIILNVSILNKDLTLTSDDVIKQAKKVFEKYVQQGYTKEDIVLIMNEMNLKNVNSNQLEVKSTKIIFTDEIVRKENSHKVERKFKFKKEFNFEGAEFGMVKTDNNTKFKIKITFSSKKVTDFYVDFETGVLSNGVWGGIKYTIKK